MVKMSWSYLTACWTRWRELVNIRARSLVFGNTRGTADSISLGQPYHRRLASPDKNLASAFSALLKNGLGKFKVQSSCYKPQKGIHKHKIHIIIEHEKS